MRGVEDHGIVGGLHGREIASGPWREAAGSYRATWTTRDPAGRALPSGVYFARIGKQRGARLVVLHP